MNLRNKLECYVTLGWRVLPITNTVTNQSNSLVTNQAASGVIFTTLNFFVTYELTQSARVLRYTTLERLARDKNSSFLDSINYE
jgi:hypothetical protein